MKLLSEVSPSVHHNYPALSQSIYSRPIPPTPIFSLHTYLIGASVIKKTVSHDLRPALHSAEAKVIELSSDISLVQFLMVLLNLQEAFSFH